MKRNILLLITGVLIGAFVFGGTVFAATQKTATLNYNDIKITLDGTALIPTDANGKPVEPFIIDGTTYLPVRAVANALGLGVGWDASTQTVSLTNATVAASVYITRTGSKYHYDGSCNGGTYWPVPFDTATGMGLEPCEKCVK